jgi:hypothetical protein
MNCATRELPVNSEEKFEGHRQPVRQQRFLWPVLAAGCEGRWMKKTDTSPSFAEGGPYVQKDGVYTHQEAQDRQTLIMMVRGFPHLFISLP